MKTKSNLPPIDWMLRQYPAAIVLAMNIRRVVERIYRADAEMKDYARQVVAQLRAQQRRLERLVMEVA